MYPDEDREALDQALADALSDETDPSSSEDESDVENDVENESPSRSQHIRDAPIQIEDDSDDFQQHPPQSGSRVPQHTGRQAAAPGRVGGGSNEVWHTTY